MKIEQAYCTDINEIVNTEDAYDFYWAGIIKDKKNFECPSSNCEASITCANIYKLRQDMKVDPYFKVTSKHNPECDLLKEINIKKYQIENIEEIKKPRNKKDEELADIFIFSRPKNHIEKKEISPTQNNQFSIVEKRKVKTSKSNTINSQASQFYTIRSFVSKYDKYKKQNLLDKRFINIKNNKIPYSEMFVEISNQNIESLSKYPRIYFAKVFINKFKNEDYNANFTSTFILKDKKIRPKVYLSQKLINNSFTNDLMKNKIEDLSTKNYPEVWAFIYATPQVKIIDEKEYINFNIFNLDYLDFRNEI
ncbi:hypothetical protein [Sulfurimonas sp.]|uniref:hypothetical protein n=1 Tax=Sulfurimonas sp. TaxID=2022749 RepID=UPI002B468181|nr:hypothetical protein [Sulfurimonas sp.]